jgi:molybdopterin/thiamine biosynthesis adenylyltransferase
MSSETERDRYAAHRALTALGEDGHAAIRASSILLIGLGGLGCAAAQYLTGSGIGRLILCDFDTVAESNLARQVLYGAQDVGRLKTHAARDALFRLNPDTALTLVEQRMDQAAIARRLAECDLLIDASDNYGTRLAANRACRAAGTPWVMGSCVRMEGQLMLFRGTAEEACYRCAYGSAPDTLEDCPGAGVFSPLAGCVGTAMAHLALGHLTGGVTAPGMHLIDGATWRWRTLGVRQRPDCPDCAG